MPADQRVDDVGGQVEHQRHEAADAVLRDADTVAVEREEVPGDGVVAAGEQGVADRGGADAVRLGRLADDVGDLPRAPPPTRPAGR